MHPRPRHALASLASALLLGCLAAAPACVFFVPDTGKLETTECHFQAETEACGACIAAACVPELNGCCTESDCKSQLAKLDACSTTATPSACNALSTTGIADVTSLGKCIATSCPVCFVDAGSAEGTTGGSSDITCFSADATLCTCGTSGDEPGLGTQVQTCDESAGLTCCAQTGWPGGEDGLSMCVCTNQACPSTDTEVSSCGP